MPKLLEMKGITKRFPGVVANDDVDFDLLEGEIHALLGENGAGKSTLMKILFGLYQPEQGEIFLNGAPLKITSPASAIEAGIGMIHQHFMLVPSLTVTENVALGLHTSDMDTVSAKISSLADRYNLQVDPKAKIWQLSVGERQRVEILKALYRDARLLVLDEPAAVLTPQEVDDFFVTLRQLAEDNRGLIFISHKLHEVLALSHRITVLRGGKISGATTPSETSREELAELMVGRQVNLVPQKPYVEKGNAKLVVQNLKVTGDRETLAVDEVSIQIHAGEIVGIAGVSGNGQRELAECIAGLRKSDAGKIMLGEDIITNASPRLIRKKGLSYVPEERMKDGAIGDFTVKENLMLIGHDNLEFSRKGFLRMRQMTDTAQTLIEEFDVKTPSIDTMAKSLSGGNIQKLIMARELSSNPAVLLAAQPTRGVDIGAAEYIHEQLIDQRNRGTAIVVISEDLDEILALSDRVLVIFEGRVVANLPRSECSVARLGLLMGGAKGNSIPTQANLSRNCRIS